MGIQLDTIPITLPKGLDAVVGCLQQSLAGVESQKDRSSVAEEGGNMGLDASFWLSTVCLITSINHQE